MRRSAKASLTETVAISLVAPGMQQTPLNTTIRAVLSRCSAVPAVTEVSKHKICLEKQK